MSHGIGRGKSRPSQPATPNLMPTTSATDSSLTRAFRDYFSLGRTPTLEVAKSISQIRKEQEESAAKKQKIEPIPEPEDIQARELHEHQKYVQAMQKEREEKARRSILQRGHQDPAVKIEKDENGEEIVDLDSVSTIMDDVGPLIDPDFKQKISNFFVESRRSAQSQELPIAKKKKHIINQILSNRVVIIEGKTGCGKTTQVPQYIMDDCYGRERNFNIVVTQPRRIAAKSVAQRVCNERNWTLGQIVGYQIGMDKTCAEDTRLLYVTTGVLLQKLLTTKTIDNYSHIIIDEVHERNAETDLLLMVIYQLMYEKSCPTRIILMSATFDTQKFKKYFSVPMPRGGVLTPVIIKIDEQVHDLVKNYLDKLREDYADEMRRRGERIEEKFDKDDPYLDPFVMSLVLPLLSKLEQIEAAREQSVPGAVLIFLPGFEQITALRNLLDRAKPNHVQWFIVPLHSSITLEEQHKIFTKPTRWERKIILSTNIAESSITVPDCEYVVDFCLTKTMVCDPETNYPTLKMQWASQANCDQRAGRTGRTCTGRVYRMVPEKFYHELDKSSLPELLCTPLENSVLKVKRLDMGPPKKLLAQCIDPPNISDIKRAILRLKRVGALSLKMNDGRYDEEDGNLTFLGTLISQLPLDVQLARFIVIGHVLDCLDDCITIAACLSLQNFFIKPFDRQLDSYKARLAWADGSFSDPMAYYNAVKMFEEFINSRLFLLESNKAQQWCKQNFIQYKRLRDVLELSRELHLRVENLGLRPEPRPNREARTPGEDELMLKVCIAGGFYPHYFSKGRIDKDMDVSRELNSHDPRNTVRLDGLPLDEGAVYANQIRMKMKDISEDFDMEFENTKAFITFFPGREPLDQATASILTIDNEPQTTKSKYLYGSQDAHEGLRTRSVQTEVYLAIKKRKMRADMTLSAYNKIYVRDLMERMRNIRDDKLTRNNQMRRNMLRISSKRVNPLPEIALPSQSKATVEIFVTEITSVCDFWAQFRDHNSVSCKDALMVALQSIEFQGNYANPSIGDLVLAEYRDFAHSSVLHRARVHQVDPHRKCFSIFFVDYGTVTSYKFSDAHLCMRVTDRMPTEIFSIPPLAVSCRLAKIKPHEILEYESGMSDSAVRALKELVSGRTDLWGMIFSVVNKRIALNLFIGQDKMSVGDQLMIQGYVQFAEEDAASRSDHQIRESLTTSALDHHLEPQNLIEKEKCFEVNLPDEDTKYSRTHLHPRGEKLKLKGPFTPIEIKFVGLTRQDSSASVEVDPDSVNSVSLDPDPVSSCQRLLVAAHLTVSENTGKIIARSTTLMPLIRGLAAMVTMIFAPNIELRYDRDMKVYTGAICGLGYREDTNVSYDPENDIETEFDVVMVKDDIKGINAVRHQLNEILSTEESFNVFCGNSLRESQDHTRSIISDLFRKRRLLQVIPNSTKNIFKWGKLEEQGRVRPNQTIYGAAGWDPIFSLIDYFTDQNDEEDWLNELAIDLEGLKILVLKQDNQTFLCRLCGVKTYTFLDLRCHAVSEPHVTRVKEIYPYSRWTDFQVADEFGVD
ncbi:tudor domain containing 9 protein spindle E [Brevipalpus obovatus]|uniref:tudor domain containing 9 protein spindle E n=1 Tax=Brevipalpus obovatus TaxID=246614 RepID=UPI003D9EC44B